MPLEQTANFGLPLPHPENNPRDVDVPRLIEALELIDAALEEIQGTAEGRATTGQIAAAVAALKGAVSENYDTLGKIEVAIGALDAGLVTLQTTVGTKAASTALASAVAALSAAIADEASARALAIGGEATARTAGLAAEASARSAAIAALLPIGSIVSAMSSPGSNWRACDGASYLQSAYPELFAKVGLIKNSVRTEAGAASPPSASVSLFARIKKGNGQYMVANSRTVAVSTNRVTWAKTFEYPTDLGECCDIAWGNGKWIMVHPNINNAAQASASGTDGWTSAGTVTGTNIDFRLGHFLVLTGTQVRTSTGNGVWTLRTTPALGASWLCSADNGSRVVIAGSGGEIIYSDDLVTWYPAVKARSSTVYCLLHDGTRWLAGHDDGLSQSLDGHTWSIVAGSSGMGVRTMAQVRDVLFVANSLNSFNFSVGLASWTNYPIGVGITGMLADGKTLLRITGNSVSGVVRQDLMTYDPATEFCVPNITDQLMVSPPSEAVTRTRWIKAAA